MCREGKGQLLNHHVSRLISYLYNFCAHLPILKSRHIQFIGLGGSIGTGLFLVVGRALTAGGSLSMLLGFAIAGVFVFGMVGALPSQVLRSPH
jgi:L-asparagine transporter-like permease